MKDCVNVKKRCTKCACATGAIEKRVIIIIIIIAIRTGYILRLFPKTVQATDIDCY